ncbi:histidine kinase [Flavobacterium sp. MFBS3-15]|uniref:histidine kinase n=1 Tax=Flavobacterium sp. MFBS3-15 TaxID=2989816 RepID=UPI002236AE5D|nr:histidine kinase [Flavobacterium sp. MFBS3-15]MCW4467679.1 histidine kinase [Flavobacterium sp. MFBS3-15]
MPFKRYFFIAFLLLPTFIYAQGLLPFVENFTKSEYAGDNQVWNVAQGTDNAMYFANNHFFLRYNGVKWEKYALPNKTIIRSVFVDGDKVYCGSYKEFGYWQRRRGTMQYTSLSKDKNLFLGNADNEEIWKVFKHDGKIYFQSFNEIYIHDGKSVDKIKFPYQISYCYLIDNLIYVASVRNGMYIMEGRKFRPVDSWPELKGNVIHGMEKNRGDIYIFSKNNGVYIASGQRLIPWKSTVNNLLKDDVILAAKFIDENTLAIGTGLKGLYIINLNTGEYQNINRENALKNNAVLSITLDREKDIWLGLDNGISHVEVNSPVSVFSDGAGILGSVYSLATTEKGYLFVTNHGIFTYDNRKLVAVPNSQGQVWDIYKNGSEFVIGHNDGTFIYNGNALKWVNPVNGGWKFLKSRYDNVWFQANYSGIAIYKDINDLTKWKVLDSITKPIRNIEQNKPGELWAADNYRSLYRITYDSDFNVEKVENISALNDIKSDFGVRIFNFRNQILFLINNTWYSYNSISAKLEKHNSFNENFRNISDIIPIDDNNFMVIREGRLYTISQVDNDFIWKLLPEKYYAGRLIMGNTLVNKDNNRLLVNLDDGFLSFEPGRDKPKKHHITIEGFYQGAPIFHDTEIKYNQPVLINVISGYFGYNHPDLFYSLNGEDFIPVEKGSIMLNNLSSGKQELEVFYNNGIKYVKLADYEFRVSRPWYFSLMMIFVYVFVISGIFFLYYRWNKVRYNQKIRLNEEELKHRREILELEMEAENKQRQQEYEKHMLEIEVQSKASEVAGKSLSIAKHSEMIESIQEILESENEGSQIKSRIKKILKTNAINKNEWLNFEKNLLKSHEEFVERLSKKYPDLTPKDIKLSIYLKMNLSSKEIAPMMNISFRGVELHRYRLRKKLGISTEESLYKFMINV